MPDMYEPYQQSTLLILSRAMVAHDAWTSERHGHLCGSPSLPNPAKAMVAMLASAGCVLPLLVWCFSMRLDMQCARSVGGSNMWCNHAFS